MIRKIDMTTFRCGLTHAPVTPFRRDLGIDYETCSKLLDFHIRNGADAIALPMPEGEDLSLTDTEQRALIEFAVKQVKGRVPVIAHVSDAGTMIAVERARHAEKAGVDAIVSHPPYFWHPKPAMVVEHIVSIGSAVGLPFFVCTPPVENVGTHLTADMFMQLVDRLGNLRGIVDAVLSVMNERSWFARSGCLSASKKRSILCSSNNSDLFAFSSTAATKEDLRWFCTLETSLRSNASGSARQR